MITRTLLLMTLLAGGCKSKNETPAAGSGSAPPVVVASGSASGSAAGSGSGSAVAVGSGLAAGSAAGSNAGSDAVPPSVFDRSIAAYSAKEQKVAYKLGHSVEGTDMFDDFTIADLTGKELEHPEVPGHSAPDYQAKYDAVIKSLVVRGFTDMISVEWPETATTVDVGGRKLTFSKTAATSTILADGKPFTTFKNEATHAPHPISVSFVPGTPIGLVALAQNAKNYGQYNNFTTGSIGTLKGAPFSADPGSY